MSHTLEQIDLMLGESLELMMQVSREIKKTPNLELRERLIHVGRATTELWEVREQIYKIDPELKRDFVQEYSAEPQRFEELNAIFREATQLETAGKTGLAEIKYEELLNVSDYGYFKLLAEAGLYRTLKDK